jgi:tetratricopeptide (TPR) repeat protein
LGTTSEAIVANKNARIANSKFARYAEELGQYAEAAQSLDALLGAFPKEKGYLRRAALAHFESGNYERSLTHWRTLLSGVPSRSDDWYEAKYYQVRCLLETDPTTAARVLRQFQLLDPDLGPPAWRSKFQTLKP